jgi:hypothetical protein
MSKAEALRSIKIRPGTMINTGVHEDDDCFITTQPVTAQVVGPPKDGAIPVVIPQIGRDRIVFFHQSEPAAGD